MNKTKCVSVFKTLDDEKSNQLSSSATSYEYPNNEVINSPKQEREKGRGLFLASATCKSKQAKFSATINEGMPC